VREALQGLGWSARDADAAADAVAPEAEAGADVPTLLRSALQTLART
jgi:Holliday junction DNA helicase RuvA